MCGVVVLVFVSFPEGPQSQLVNCDESVGSEDHEFGM